MRCIRFGSANPLTKLTRFAMEYFIGIDPASEAFVASGLTAPAEPCLAPRTFSNNPEGFAAFEDWLAREEITKAQAIICVENTGVYSEALCYALHRQGFSLVLLDPHAVWKAFSDERKTDALDSRKIAEYAYRYRDRIEPWTPHEAVVEQVKTLLSTREHLVEQRTAMKNARRALARKAVETPAANEALDASLDASTEHLAAQINAIEKAIRSLIAQHPTMAQMVGLLVSAPGVGELLASHLLVLSEGFTKALRYRKLAAYLGLCPNEKQSGKSRKRSRSRGYGPSMVRKLLHLAARSVKTHDERFRRYFHRKCGEGKAKRLVLNNIANKLLRVLCGMIERKQPYIEHYQSIHPRLLRTGTRS